MADPICRWRNATPKTICEIVETLPKNEMSESEFRLIMNQSKWKESFFRTVYQLWLHYNICMHCRVYRTHQDFQPHGCSVHTICHDLWTVLLVGVGGAPACHA